MNIPVSQECYIVVIQVKVKVVSYFVLGTDPHTWQS